MRARNVIIKGIFDPVTEMHPLVVDWADPEEDLETSKVIYEKITLKQNYGYLN